MQHLREHAHDWHASEVCRDNATLYGDHVHDEHASEVCRQNPEGGQTTDNY
jgi:hypothetical protein